MDKNPRVTILYWYKDVDDLALTIAACLRGLGYEPLLRHYTTEDYDDARFLFTYAPWGRLQRITTRLEAMSPEERPFWIHWSTEDCPDLRLPKRAVRWLGGVLARIDRLQDQRGSIVNIPPMRWINQRFSKFRYVGMYDYATRQGLMGLLLEYSKVYTDYYAAMGIPVEYARWGVLDSAGNEQLETERDIDVLWIGTRRTSRRSKLLDNVIGQLNALGRRTYVVDGVSHPPVYGLERSRLLHRAKITLNLLPTWYDSALAYRWPLAASSRSLLVTEQSLPHAPEYRPNEHYVSAPISSLVETICYYLDRPEERAPIVERAYQAVSNCHRISDSVQQIMQWAEERARSRGFSQDKTPERLARIMTAFAPSITLLLSGMEKFQ